MYRQRQSNQKFSKLYHAKAPRRVGFFCFTTTVADRPLAMVPIEENGRKRTGTKDDWRSYGQGQERTKAEHGFSEKGTECHTSVGSAYPQGDSRVGDDASGCLATISLKNLPPNQPYRLGLTINPIATQTKGQSARDPQETCDPVGTVRPVRAWLADAERKNNQNKKRKTWVSATGLLQKTQPGSPERGGGGRRQ